MGDIKQELHNFEQEITYTYEAYDEEERIDEIQACRVCLLTDCKLYPLVGLNKEDSYMQVSGLSLHVDEGLPTSLCAECYTLLNKCMQFREKSRMGYQCLMKILEKHSEVTVDIIKKVNRKKFNLNSNLTIIQKKPNFDYEFVDEFDVLYDDNKIKQESIVEYNTYKDDDHFNAMDDDTKDSTESDMIIIIENTNSEIVVPFKIVKKRKSKHIEGEEITFDNLATDNVCKNFDENIKVEPVISEVENNKSKAEDHLKRSQKQLHLKANDNNKKKQNLKDPDYIKKIKKNFIIKALSIEEQREILRNSKSSDNYIKSAYKCDYCFKGFISELTYESHMMRHTEKYGKLVCDICNKHWMNKETLRNHMKYHTHLYSCMSCSYTTHTRRNSKLHLEWHKGKTYKCEICDVVFLRITTLMSHLRIKHPTDHVCHMCGYSFIGETGINAHCRMKHRQESGEVSSDSPRCVECDIRFTSELALQTHLEVSLRHADLGKLKRNEPQFSDKRVILRGKKVGGQGRRVQADVPRNWREPIGDKNAVTCKECGSQFRTRHAHRIHMRWKHPAALPVTGVGIGALCDVCGRAFKCEALLRDHALVHSESASFSCAVCGKSYKTHASLQTHSRLHVKSYPCPRCDKTFNLKSNRDRHLTNVHSDVRDVKCDYCEKFFKSDEVRKSHTDHVHLQKPWPKRNRQRAKGGQTIARRKSGKGTTNDLCAEQAK